MSGGPAKGAGVGGPAKGRGGGGPARGYSWPAFGVNNQASVTHGARSERLVGAGAERFRAALFAEAPWLEAEHFRAAATAWAKAEERARRYLEHAAGAGLLDSSGAESGSSRAAGRWMDRARRLREDLGITPSSYARIRRDLAIGGRDLASSLVELEAAGE